MKRNTIQLNRKELIDFIIESATQISERMIFEQSSVTSQDPLRKKETYLKRKTSGTYISYPTPAQQEKGWKENFSSEARDYLIKNGIKPGMKFTTSEYLKFKSQIRAMISGYVYPANDSMTTLYSQNVAVAEGDKVYVFMPGPKTVHLQEIRICWSKKLDRAIDCDTKEPMTEYDITGHDVQSSSLLTQALFDFEVGGEMLNTKYFCPKYLMQTEYIPKTVRPRVFKWMQQAFSAYDGRDLGLNKISSTVTPEVQFIKNLKDVDQKLMSSNKILKVVADYISDKVIGLEAEYHAGLWRLTAGSPEEPEFAKVPLSPEKHKEYFDRLKHFATSLLDTNCGFGTPGGGDEELEDMQQQMMDKYQGIMQFADSIPDDWDDLDDVEKQEFLDDYNAQLEEIQRQDDIQFIWDMIGLGLVLVAAIVLAIPSGGSSLAVAGGIMMASGVAIGVGSAMFDYYQGQWVLGTIGLTLELIPFAKVFKLWKMMKHVPQKTIDEMFAYAMKHGPKAVAAKQFGKYSGKEFYNILMKNKDELVKMVGGESKAAKDFLKTFASMDATEYYMLLRVSKPWAKAFGKMEYKVFKEGLSELNTIVFANKTYWKSFFTSFLYNFGKPMKILLANLAAAPLILTVSCYNFEFRLIKKIKGIGKNLTYVPGDETGDPIYIIKNNVKWVTMTLDPQYKNDVSCMLIDIIFSRATNTPDEATNEYIENLMDQENIQIDDDKITITRLDEDGKEETVELVADETTENLTDIADGLVRALVEVMCSDEDIYATMIWHLGDGNLETGENKLNDIVLGITRDPNKLIEWMDLMDWVVVQPVYTNRKAEFLEKIRQLRLKYE